MMVYGFPQAGSLYSAWFQPSRVFRSFSRRESILIAGGTVSAIRGFGSTRQFIALSQLISCSMGLFGFLNIKYFSLRSPFRLIKGREPGVARDRETSSGIRQLRPIDR
jgi:hypothetical protein